ncbi:transcriptional regulator containing an amidase domain and an AraC-type DNA-binding HTH domain [Mycolicibacterium chubuense NBB4]|uniref:Transcriptional regulator containing an amidase domain and an AraC-type DNA-binding HTH domain n=1 Tax=Mycolicibacterium chubuense (strain NBB4) TaxID=710421 RepID=I4BMR1_MYCCN|nr:helix-turn-helix transcriptional regulator [Mycolicibacterium chubuense]AFM18568.1 transcriptional regulator containing an amidase domain and an AraC-type DNA-binding HTH domain [Mycolicibacterium chubuense NBB4]
MHDGQSRGTATAGDFVINTTDLQEAEKSLSTLFGTIRLSTPRPQHNARTQLWRSHIDHLVIDDAEFTFDMGYEMDPPDSVLLCRVHSGILEETPRGQASHRYGTGSVVAFGAVEGRPLIGRVEQSRYHVLTVPRRCLAEAAGDVDASTSLTSSRPLSPAANQYLVDVIDHVRHGVLSNPRAAREPLVAAAVTRYVAASMLAAFPNTPAGPSRPAGDDDNHEALRRATAFIEDHAGEDISLADIARAARVSPPTLGRLFRRHRQITPMQYLQEMRLRSAHRQLVDADPTTDSVAGVAHRWGFWHLGRFRQLYRSTYGDSPESTLTR